MTYRINIIIQNVAILSEEIVAVANNTAYSDDLVSILNNRLSEKKDILGLVNYSFYTPKIDWCYSFVVSLNFNNLDERYEIEFVNTNPKSHSPRYEAKLVNPILLISSKPLCFPVEGIVCCEECHRMLYVNPFYFDLPSIISVQDVFLMEGLYNEKRRLANFMGKLSLIEKQQIKIANASFLEDSSNEYDYNEYFYGLNEGIQWLKEKVDISLISCIVAQDKETVEILRRYMPYYFRIIGTNEDVPTMTREEWIRKAILMMINEFAYVANKSKYLNDSLALFMKKYHCSKTIIMEICKEIMNDSDFESLRKHLSYPLM